MVFGIIFMGKNMGYNAESFSRHLTKLGLSDNTIRSYSCTVTRYMNIYRDVTEQSNAEWRSKLIAIAKPATINLRIIRPFGLYNRCSGGPRVGRSRQRGGVCSLCKTCVGAYCRHPLCRTQRERQP